MQYKCNAMQMQCMGPAALERQHHGRELHKWRKQRLQHLIWPRRQTCPEPLANTTSFEVIMAYIVVCYAIS